MSTMLAGRLVARGLMACETAPSPERQPGCARVRTLTASICGSDFHVIDLAYYGRGRPAGSPGPPGFPGHESIVEIIDDPTGGFPPGTIALAVPPANRSAAYAEFQVIDPASLVALPDPSRWESQVLAQQFGTVLFAMDRFWDPSLHIPTVAIVGAGSAGLLFAHEARQRGAGNIIVTDPSPTRRDRALRAGAHHAVDPADEGLQQAVADLTDGVGVHLSIDASGEDAGRRSAVDVLAFDGIFGLFGLPMRAGGSPLNLATFFERRARMIATHSAQLEPGLRSFRRAIDRLSTGELDHLDLLTHRFPLERIDEAVQIARERDEAIKVLIDVARPSGAPA